MSYASSNGYFGLVPEITRGTLNTAGTPVYIGVDTPQITEGQKFIDNDSFYGSMTTIYDQVQGVRADTWEGKFGLYVDTIPTLFKAALGSADTVTGSGPYLHTFLLLNNPSVGSQPESLSLMSFDGANYFTLLAAQLDTLEFTSGAEVKAETMAKFIANPYTAAESAPPAPFSATPTFTPTHMVPGWATSYTIAGVAIDYIKESTVTLNRKTESIFTQGQQAPYQNFAGPLEVSGKLTAIIANQNDIWSVGASGTGADAYALTRSPQPVTITFTDPNDASGTTLEKIEIIMSSVQFSTAKRNVGKIYTEIEVEFKCNADTTDSGSSSQYSPIQINVTNSVATPY